MSDEWLKILTKVDNELYDALLECDDYEELRGAVRQIYQNTIPDLPEGES